jgi:CarD family transcriptional regulator
MSAVSFALHEKVVYPSYGVAKISNILEKTISGKSTILYELKFINKKEMTILIPISNLAAIGVRQLSSAAAIDSLISILSEVPERLLLPEAAASSWKHRNKMYQLKLRKGSLKDIGEIYRDLRYIEQCKELSFCEKDLLLRVESLLSEEIALVKKCSIEKALEYIRSCFLSFHQLPTAGIKQKVI